VQRKPVSSSQIRSIGHDPATSTLEVEFHAGGVYQYDNVTAAHHKALMDAPSIGSHFHRHIKTAVKEFPYRRVNA
jgi:hypothetical protein